jgi:hypothetical protein
MILLAAILIAFLLAFLSGGKFGRLADLSLRLPALAVAAFVLQLYMIYAPDRTLLQTALLAGSYVMLFVFVWLNRRLAGIVIIGVGLTLNFAVMVANGGYMPISPEAVAQVGHEHELLSAEVGARLQNTKDILLPREQTNLWFLSDVFVLPPPFPIPSVFSPGDVFLALGAAALILLSMHGRLPARPSPQPLSQGERG